MSPYQLWRVLVDLLRLRRDYRRDAYWRGRRRNWGAGAVLLAVEAPEGLTTTYYESWSNPWPAIVPALAGVLVILLAIELVIVLVKMAVRADDSAGGDV